MLFGSKAVLVSPPMVPALPSMRTGLVLPMLMLLPRPSCTPSAVVVLVMLPSPFTLMVSPNAYCVLVLPSPNLMPLAMAAVLVAILPALVATFWLVAYSWLPVTASVLPAAIVPSARLVTLSPPTSSPFAPLLNTVLLPASPSFTLVNSGVSLVAMLMVPLSWVMAMFLPASMVTVSLGWISCVLLPLTLPPEAVVVNFQPLLATPSMLLSASCTLL